jgi:hypothetical protein
LVHALIGWAAAMAGGPTHAADITFNLTKIGEENWTTNNSAPTKGSTTQFYGDVWGEGVYAYVGSDVNGGGLSIYDISDPVHPLYIHNAANPNGQTTYAADQIEDVEVYDGIAYLGSDVTTGSSGTGVDIVDVSNPFSPQLIKRLSTSSGFPKAHNKVHTLSVSNGFLYTADNATDVIKVWNVSDPYNPVFVDDYDLGLTDANFVTHEVQAIGGRLYVASKSLLLNDRNPNGYAHVFDISNVGTTGLQAPLAVINTGRRTHTATATPDGKLMVIAQEYGDVGLNTNGEVKLYDTSNLSSPVLLSTITKPLADAYSPHHPHIHNDLLFVTWYEAGLWVYNIADPVHPIAVGAYDTYPGTSTNYNGDWGVFHLLGYDKLLVSDRTRGLIILDGRGVEPNPDFDLNNNVDGIDFLTWQRGFGMNSGGTLALGDGNRDTKIGAADLSLWRRWFGDSNHQHYLTAVPEGSTVGMLALGSLLLGGWRRRAR